MYAISLQKNEPVSEGIKRLLNERIDIVLTHCSTTEDIHHSIHEIRRNIKKIRGILRMVRDEIGFSAYYRENNFYRDMSRLLSEIRSSEILHHSLELARTKIRNKKYHELLESISIQIISRRDQIITVNIQDENITAFIGAEIEKNRHRIQELPLENDHYSVFIPGIKRIYKHNREHHKICRKNPEINALHDFRKKIKYLLAQLQVIYPVFPELLKVQISLLDTIGDKLGIYRDLYELQDFIEGLDFQKDEIPLVLKLKEDIEIIKAKQLAVAMEKTDKVFSIGTKMIISQLNTYKVNPNK